MWKYAVTEKLGELSILQLYFSSKPLDSNGNSALAEIGSAINTRYILCRLQTHSTWLRIFNMLFDETGRVSSGFPGCTRDDGTAMNSVFNSITSVVLVMSIMLNVINSINNNNNNNDNNNNNNDNNNVSTK